MTSGVIPMPGRTMAMRDAVGAHFEPGGLNVIEQGGRERRVRAIAVRGISAIASRQSEVLEDEEELDKSFLEAREFLDNNPDYAAKAWRVFSVAPDDAEFWQGATDRNHNRLCYRLAKGSSLWNIVRLWPCVGPIELLSRLGFL